MKNKIKKLIKRIKNREFKYIIKRLSVYILPQINGEFYANHQFGYNILVSTYWTRFLNMPKDYGYIIAGSHGVGFAAFIKYMQKINANPMTLDNMFARSDYVLLARKHAMKYKNQLYGLSIDKTYIDTTRRKCIEKLESKVPVFCLIRGPISIIRTHTHYHIILKLTYGLKTNKIIIDGGINI